MLKVSVANRINLVHEDYANELNYILETLKSISFIDTVNKATSNNIKTLKNTNRWMK